MALPAYADFMIIFGICLIFYALLRILTSISNKWKEMMMRRIAVALAKRKAIKDDFRARNGYSWDYVCIFKVFDSDEIISKVQNKFSMKYILTQIADAGLETKLFYSAMKKQVFCKIRAALPRLSREADRVNYKLNLDPMGVSNYLAEGKKSIVNGEVEKDEKGDEIYKWKPVYIPEGSLLTNIAPTEYIYAKFEDKPHLRYLYKTWENNTIFRGVDRLKLLSSIIKARKSEGGAFLDIFRRQRDGCIDSFYPLHDFVELRTIEEKWLIVFQLPWNQNVDVAKDYFGEKIGFYFLFLGHYTSWLFPAAFVGFLCWIDVAAEDNNPNANSMPVFAVFMALWSTFFLEYWKRKEKTYAMKWGMSGFEDEEIDRPQFEGDLKPNPVDGRPYFYFSSFRKNVRLFVTSSMAASLTLTVVGVIAAIFVMRIIMSKSPEMNLNGINLAGSIASIANALQIQIFGVIYDEFAIRANSYENHRTDTQYEDALITKTFVFQFINSYAALWYIAFIKPFIAELDPCLGTCMQELSTSLSVIFIVRLLVGNFTAVAVPAITRRYKDKQLEEVDEVSEVEHSSMRGTYDVLLGTFQDYAGAVIQYGYATMFISSFPLAVVMAVINNYVQLRIDAWKLCQEYRRPEPRSQEDIGSWYDILEIISFCAVLTNSGIIAFTGTIFINSTWIMRVWIFILMVALILGAKFTFAFMVPDVPDEVNIQLERQDFIISKVLYDAVDDFDDENTKKVKLTADFVIRITDDDPM